ncbi:unnamed protein product [Menidia menidia]|uniref:(Atlantic silverside) hypothetical protein n=1 Tax=Menidia menidia TaxID=238744 RepID=A0A8S4A798_9TELE|nr:unnamed protein product [Menidia menidia]
MAEGDSCLGSQFSFCSRAQWDQRCSEQVEVHTERRGVIYSPSWPANYPPGVNCSWRIQGGPGEVVTISFRSFDVAESARCAGDWLVLAPAWSGDPRLCGSVLPPPFISSRGRVWLHFHSQANSSGQAQGFRLSFIRGWSAHSPVWFASVWTQWDTLPPFAEVYRSDEFLCGNGKCVPRAWRCNAHDECGDGTDERGCPPPPSTDPWPGRCPPGSVACARAQTTRCLPAALRCDGAPDCPDGSDELSCPDTACGRRLGGFYGSFASPDFFRAAAPERRCSWLLDTRDPKPLLLQLDLRLGPGDSLRVYDGPLPRTERLLQALTQRDNRRPALLESSRGQMSVLYAALPRSPGRGFNATYQCFESDTDAVEIQPLVAATATGTARRAGTRRPAPPARTGSSPARGGGGSPGPAEGGGGPSGPGGPGGVVCYPASERCNNQKRCPDGSDEKNCHDCQPGNFHCGTNLCIFETWRCDGQEDCLDGSDERDCLAAVPRKVITVVLIGSLVCSLLLVIALGCALKLHSLRNREYRAFETQMTRMEAEFVQREAPPSYGQLIAQGLIPPVEDFPVYNPTQASVLQNLRLAMRRQMRRHSTRRPASSSSRRRLGVLWSRLFRGGGSRARGHAPLLDPPGPAQITLGLHCYRTAGEPGGGSAGSAGSAESPRSRAETPESPASPLSFRSDGEEASPLSSPRSPQSGPATPSPGDPPPAGRPPLPPAAAASQPSALPPRHRRPSRKLVLELAVNLKGVSLRRYSPLGPLSPASPLLAPGGSPPLSEVSSPAQATPPEASGHLSADEPRKDERRKVHRGAE